MNQHFKLKHVGMTHGGHKCKNCDYKSKSLQRVNDHFKKCSGTEIQTCDTCGYRANSFNMTLHFKSKHPGISRPELTCSQCDYTASCQSSLDSHLKLISKDDEVQECEECGFKSCTSLGLGIHTRKAHLELTETPRWTCKDCDFAAFSRYLLVKTHFSNHQSLKNWS